MYPTRGGSVHSGTCHGVEGSLASMVTDGVVAQAATRRGGEFGIVTGGNRSHGMSGSNVIPEANVEDIQKVVGLSGALSSVSWRVVKSAVRSAR